MDNIVYEKYLGEDSWIQIVQTAENEFYEQENAYGGEFRVGQSFLTLQDAIEYADSYC